MRVTLDTNILVSAFVSKHGLPADILDLIATFQEITLVLSDAILEEFLDVMNREEVRIRFGYGEADVSKFERAIRNIAEIVAIKSNFKAIEEDPEDDVVVNTAIDGRADYIVSGDRHLKKLGKFKGVRIVSPKVFMEIVARKFEDLILSKSDFQ